MGEKKPVKSASAKPDATAKAAATEKSLKPSALQKATAQKLGKQGKQPAALVEEIKPEVKEKKKEKRSQKEKPKSKKKHKKVQVWKLYDVKDGKVKRKNELCPRCGPGTFLAAFRNRKYCGKCGWSHMQKEDKK